MEKNKIYGVYFIKGAFFMQLNELNDNVVCKLLVSKNYKQLKEVIGGTYNDLESLLKSKHGTLAKMYIENLDFDYMIIGHGDSVSYYLNTSDGLVKCELNVFTNKP